MGLSKSRRMQILLAVNGLFFFIELGVGIWVHSLALVADSFHMFNDVLSLCVGIWAVNVAQSKSRSNMYTYGWQRAETLGALINGVFLVALCCSIFLEAIQRFVDVPEVSNPKWILGVGAAGLTMNILGLFLFHDHGHGGHSHDHDHAGHSHGNEAHSQKRRSSHAVMEEGHGHGIGSDVIADEAGNIADVLPENHVRASAQAIKGSNIHAMDASARKSHNVSFQTAGASPVGLSVSQSSRKYIKRRRSRGYSTLSSDIAVHPASLRKNIIAAGRQQDPESDDTSEDEDEALLSTGKHDHTHEAREITPLLGSHPTNEANSRLHANHNHTQPKSAGKGSHGHSHGDLNMRGVFLHVLGDALGNIGVIATALFIWLTPYSWRFYADPVVSLVITVIILASAVPLCMAASRILLQAVPTGLSIDEIKADILSLHGIDGCHHLHVWQLSDTKLVASLHIRVQFDFKGEGSQEYMELARQVRSCLHGYGIHSSTIQPEFLSKAANGNGKSRTPLPEPSTEDESCSQEDTASEGYKRNMTLDKSTACLLDCDDECGDGDKCCPEPPAEA